MREHVGKLHVRRTTKKPAEVHPIQIEQGPMMRPPALDIAASAERLAPAKASRLRPEIGVQHLDPQIVALQTNARKLIPPTIPVSLPQDLGPKVDPNNPLSTLLSTPNPMALSDAPIVGDVRNLGKEMPVVDRMTPESAAPIDPQQALEALNPLNGETEKMNARAAFEDGATASPESAPASQTPEVGQDTPQQPAAEAPQQQGAAPEGQDTQEGEAEAALPEAEAQQPAADQPAQVPPPPAAEGNDAGANNGQGQGGNAGGGNAGGGGIGGGPELTPFEQAPAALDTSASGPMVQSLGKQQPTAIVATLSNVPSQLTTAQQGDIEQAKTLLPEIEQPTGLGTDGVENKKAAKSELKEEKAPEIKKPSDGKKQEVKTEHKLPEGKSPAEKIQTPSNEALKSPGSLGNAIRNIPEVDPSISTTAGPRPQVELSGDADPQHNQTAQVEADTSTQEASAKARTETEKDFKEGEIMPAIEKETLKVSQELTAPEGWSGEGGAVLPQLDAQTAAALNSGITAQHQAQIDAELAKETEGKAEFDQKAQEEQQKGLDKIKEENEKVKQQQLDERAKGKQTIDGHREEWRAENDKVMQDFDTKSKAEREKVDGKIQAKVTETNTKIESEYAKAETEAKAKTESAQKEIDAKKEEAEKKEQDKSWWDKLRDAVSAFFDALKKAVSAIFDALKKAVKFIIETVKQLASELINMARDLIKGLISAFAEMLKAFVRLALAAFPELAERFCAMIDQAVEAIHKAIDQLAEALKAVVNMLLDAIGAAINMLLDAFAAIINGILTVIQLLATDWKKLIEGIANLGKAAVQAPDHYLGQVSEEMLGSDVTQPLPNEYPAESAAAETPAPESQETFSEAPEANAQEPAGPNEALLARDTYTADDFDVPVAQNENFGPELMAEISAMGEGSHEIASFDDAEHGKEAIKADAMGGTQPETAAPEASEGPAMESTASEGETATAAGPAPADPNRDRFTPDGQDMVGPFSSGERLLYVGKQMVDGIKKWFSENWPVIVAALIGIIAGAVIALVLTAGAITAAVPLILQLVAAYFAAEAIVNMSKHFGAYLGKAFPGDVAGGAKSLARALAIGSIELVFALLFGGKAAFKAVKNVAKTAAKGGVKAVAKSGVAAAKAGIKSTAKAAGDLGKVIKNGFKNPIKNTIKSGRFVLTGLKNGFSRGVKSVRTLAGKLRQFRFKKFRITIQNRKWQLEGKVNPWVLLASGKIVAVDPQDVKDVKKGEKVGQNVTVNGEEGVIVGSHGGKSTSAPNAKPSQYVDDLIDEGEDALAELQKQLRNAESDEARRAIIKKYSDPEWLKTAPVEVQDAFKRRGTLKNNVATNAGEQAHHVNPVEALQNPTLQKAVQEGMEFNGKGNGIGLEPFSSKKPVGAQGVHASHPDYTAAVNEMYTKFDDLAEIRGGIRPGESREFAETLSSKLKAKIDELCKRPQNPVKVNDLFNPSKGGINMQEFYDDVIAGLPKAGPKP